MGATEGLVFDVEGEGRSWSDWAASYRCFVDRLRRLSPVMLSGRNFTNVCLDVTLQTSTNRTKLRMRCYNFHLVGYQMEDLNRWFEFRVETQRPRTFAPDHFIKGSCFLDLGDEYRVLGRDTDGHILDGICIGRGQLVRAMNLLATSTCLQDRVWSLIVVRLMICEGCRFTCIADYIATDPSHDNSPPPAWMIKRVHDHLSMALARLRHLQDAPPIPVLAPKLRKRKPKPKPRKPRHSPGDSSNSNMSGGNTNSDLTGGSSRLECSEGSLDDPVLSIEDNPFLGLNPDDIFAEPEVKQEEHNTIASLEFPWHPGPKLPLSSRLALAEVFSMRITSINGSKPCRFHGMIAVSNGLSLEFLYKRGEEESEPVDMGDTLPLCLPRLTMSAMDRFSITYSITGVNVRDWLGQAGWCRRYCNYDEPLMADFYGEDCSVRVYYTALRCALQVAIEVTIINGDRRGQSHVYGRIVADWGCFDYAAILFQKTALEGVGVCPMESIELIRSVICLPVGSALIVRAELYEHKVASVHDDKVAKCVLEFPIGDCRTSGGCVSRECGSIRVMVSWDGEYG